MKRLLLLFLLIYYIKPAFGQKPPLDTGTLQNWSKVKDGSITNNGAHVLYFIETNWAKPQLLVLYNVKKRSEQTFENAHDAKFSDNNKKVLFIKSADSLCIVSLDHHTAQYIPYVNSYKLFMCNGTEWVSYIQSSSGSLTLRNLTTNKSLTFNGISDYRLSRDGHTILLVNSVTHSDSLQTISYTALPQEKLQTIWRGTGASNLTLSDNGDQAAFVTEEKLGNIPLKKFWLYHSGTIEAIQLPNLSQSNIDTSLQPESISHFSQDGSKLFISLKEKSLPHPHPDAVSVDIWSYTDSKPQAQQLDETSHKSYEAVINLKTQHTILLQLENESIDWRTDDAIGIHYRLADGNEANWNRTAKQTFYNVSTSDGKRKQLTVAPGFLSRLSPNDRYIVGQDAIWKDLYCYTPGGDSTYNITSNLPILKDNSTSNKEWDVPFLSNYQGFSVAAWLQDKKEVLVYDEYDIWKIDLENRKAPVNMTTGYGRKHNIVFRIYGQQSTLKSLNSNSKVILTSFDQSNKNSGFHLMDFKEPAAPQLLTMGPYVYDNLDYNLDQTSNKKLIKRSSSTESPNYYLTEDFKQFIPISHVYPEKNHNWLTNELVNFTTLDGRSEQGILYKPEGFDSSKQYPVIITYYERKSNELNRYPQPASPNGDLDIAWFVSNGYLVFTPDIHYTIGHTGLSAYNSILGAANYLSKFPWVNAKKMGIQGHSFGGYETNYMITHTDLFAAAVSSSGPSDLISFSNNLIFVNLTAQSFTEVAQLRMGKTLWEQPDLYIENSPIFQANNVTTPLLLVSNKKDNNVAFTQGLEFFLALRRLGKRAWMLQYDNGGHGVNGKEYIDYLMRMTQFFDHYLKGEPPGKWMTRGIPARLKGIDNGFELDREIETPGPGLLLK